MNIVTVESDCLFELQKFTNKSTYAQLKENVEVIVGVM